MKRRRDSGADSGAPHTHTHTHSDAALHSVSALQEVRALIEELSLQDVLARKALLNASAGLDTKDGVISADAHEAAFPGLPYPLHVKVHLISRIMQLRRLGARGASLVLPFHAPTRVDAAGSLITGGLTQPSPTVDLVVEMPASCFESRDIKDFLYLDKRHMYAAVCAQACEQAVFQPAALTHTYTHTHTAGKRKAAKLQASPQRTDSMLLFESVKVEAWRHDVGKGVLLCSLSPSAVRVAIQDATSDAAGADPMLEARVRALSVVRVRVLFAVSADVFPAHLLEPASRHCHVRPWALTASATPSEDVQRAAPATPWYNSCVSEDVHLFEVTARIHRQMQRVQAASGAVCVLKSWARRRGLHRSPDGIDSTILTAITAACIAEGRVTASMTELQVLRAVLEAISSRDSAVQPYILPAEEASTATEERADAQETTDASVDVSGMAALFADDRPAAATALPKARTDVRTTVAARACSDCLQVMLDNYNIAFRVSFRSLQQLQAEAGASVRALAVDDAARTPLDASGSSLFQRYFGCVFDSMLAFDRIYCLPMPHCPVRPRRRAASAKVLRAAESTGASAIAVRDLCNVSTWAHVVASRAQNVLSAALTNRVKMLRVLPTYDMASMSRMRHRDEETVVVQQWPAPQQLIYTLRDATPPSPTGFWVCMNLDEEHAGRMVERGPAPEDAEASARFTDLWGDLVQLRRFQDASITHAVVFDASRLAGRGHARSAIVPLIVSHVLSRAFGCSLPCTVMHAGHEIVMSHQDVQGLRASGRGHARAARVLTDAVSRSESAPLWSAAACVMSDVASAVPSLSLERMLDVGGVVPTQTRLSVSADSEVFGDTMVALESSPLDARVDAALTRSLRVTVSHHASEQAASAMSADILGRGPVAATSAAMQAYEHLLAALRSVPGVPMSVLSAQHISPQLRYTSLFPPMPHALAAGTQSAPKRDGSRDAAAHLIAMPALSSPLLTQQALVSLAGTGAAGDSTPTCTQVVAPMEVVCVLESSGRWPTDVAAIAALKMAFHVKLRDGLMATQRGVVYAEAFPDHLDVSLGGFVFRVYLHVERELRALEAVARRPALSSLNAPARSDTESRKVFGLVVAAPVSEPPPAGQHAVRAKPVPSPSGDTPLHDAAAAGLRLDGLYVRGVARVRHAAAIHKLATMWPAYSGTVRLAVLWLHSVGLTTAAGSISSIAALTAIAQQSLLTSSAQAVASTGGEFVPDMHSVLSAALAHSAAGSADQQGLGDVLSHEAVELLVASVFISPAPYQRPASATTGFLRFLALVSTYDWRASPLLVDLDSTATATDVRTLQSRFRASLSQERHPAMYVVTPDERGAWRPVWTHASPSADELAVLRTCAGNALQVLHAALSRVIPAPMQPSTSTIDWWCPAPTTLLPLHIAPALLRVGRHMTAQLWGVRLEAAVDALTVDAVQHNGVRWATAFQGDGPRTARQSRVSVAQAFVSRLLKDGRTCGGVKPPVDLAALVDQAPVGAAVAALQAAQRAADPGALAVATVRAGAMAVVARPVADTSKCQLLLYRNLLQQSRAELSVGLEPLTCLIQDIRRLVHADRRLGVYLASDARTGEHHVIMRQFTAEAGASCTVRSVMAAPDASHDLRIAGLLAQVVTEGAGFVRSALSEA